MNYEKIVQDNEKMIWKLASHFYGVDKEDLFQAGIVGLLKALKKYNHHAVTTANTVDSGCLIFSTSQCSDFPDVSRMSLCIFSLNQD